MKNTIPLITAFLLTPLATLHAALLCGNEAIYLE